MDSLLPTLPSAQTNPPITSPPISGIGFPPIPPAHSTPVHSSFLPPPTLQREPAAASSSGSGVIFSPTPIVRRWGAWKRPLIIWLVVLLVLASSILFSLRVLYSGHASPVSTTVGDVIFLNSGQLDAQNSQDVDDEVQINQNTTTGASSNLLSRQTKPLGNLSITLTVTPGKINVTNTVTVQIRNRHSGQFAMNAHIIVSINMDQMDMGTTQATMMGGTQAYSAIFAQDTTFSMTGIWDIMLTIQLPQQVQRSILFQVWLG